MFSRNAEMLTKSRSVRCLSQSQHLPHLPVPGLKNTLDKYLRRLQSLLSREQLNRANVLVKDFNDREGPHLQNLLEEHAKNKVNWLSKWWTEAAYLKNRLPFPINISPVMLMTDRTNHGEAAQVMKAAQIVCGSLDYKSLCDNHEIPVDYQKGKPLCMSQFYNILSGIRIPRRDIDDWMSYSADPRSKHIIVMFKNRFFKMNVYAHDCRPLSFTEIYHQLSSIVKVTTSRGPAVGILTTLERNAWADVYEELSRDHRNREILDAINKSIFMLCLDDDALLHDERSSYLSQFLHGGGSQWNSGNRWFDKTLQMIVGVGSESAICYEHTSAEGPAVVRLLDHVVSSISGIVPDLGSRSDDIQLPVELVFNLTPEINDCINKASLSIDSSIRQLDVRMVDFSAYGKNQIKSLSMSPDGFIQQAIQLAFERIYGEPGNTYESGSLRRFQEGRTDTIRTCSLESQLFVKSADKPGQDGSANARLLQNALNAHARLTEECMNGEAIDRHLLGLRILAQENSLPTPDIFTDATYKRFMSFEVSTSQVSAKSPNAVMAFGPSQLDGYGVCYNPLQDRLLFGITSFNSSSKSNINSFVGALNDSLNDMIKWAQTNKVRGHETRHK